MGTPGWGSILVAGDWWPIFLAFSHFCWVDVIIPIDELIFFRGVAQPPTSIAELTELTSDDVFSDFWWIHYGNFHGVFGAISWGDFHQTQLLWAGGPCKTSQQLERQEGGTSMENRENFSPFIGMLWAQSGLLELRDIEVLAVLRVGVTSQSRHKVNPGSAQHCYFTPR